ncbi:MAG: hypothetical protein ABIS47_09360 [Acidimicrobiales bacterium]
MPAPLTYLTMDSVKGGVGASQVLPYVERLAAGGRPVELHSFEQDDVTGDLGAGIRWHPHRFGRGGQAAGAVRVAVGAAALRGVGLVHARSDLAAASALIGRPAAWVWDVRSFWVDQRISLGMVRSGSVVERTLRSIEGQAARRSTAIITLTQAAIDELARRYGAGIASKAHVVTTCVDLQRFGPSPWPDRSLSVLLSGSYNALYDLPSMLGVVEALRRHRPTALTLLRPDPTPWDADVLAAGGRVGASSFAAMPGHVAGHHVGLSVCRAADPRALMAAMPTKIGEFLASGRPVVVNAGLGDCDALLPAAGAGVVMAGTDGVAVDRAAAQLLDLVDDPATPERCRRLAEDHFSLEGAVATLQGIYRRIEA